MATICAFHILSKKISKKILLFFFSQNCRRSYPYDEEHILVYNGLKFQLHHVSILTYSHNFYLLYANFSA